MPQHLLARLALRLTLAAILALATASTARARPRHPGDLSGLLSRPDVPPGQWLRLDRVGACTLQLDDLTTLRVRVTVPF